MEESIIDISPTLRLRIMPDLVALSSCDPLDWPGDAIETLVLDAPCLTCADFYERNPDAPRRIVQGLERAGSIRSDTFPGTGDHVIHALDRHYDRAGWTHTVASYRGPCQGDWLDLYIAMDAARYCDAARFAECHLQEWWDQDIHAAILLRRHDWHDDQGNTMHTWDEVASLGEIYGDLSEREWRTLALETLSTVR